MPLKLNSAAGGSVTLDVGSTASTYTLVFPSLSGTILTTDTSGNFVIPSGNLNLSGTGQRITGDMSNATIANRLAFQNSITNAGTALQIAPNGTAKNAQLNWETDSAMLNGVSFQINANEGLGEVRLQNGIRGTGTYLPTTFYTGGSERMRIDSSGLVGIGTSSAAAYGTLTVGQSGQPTGSEPSSRPNIEIWQGSPSINDAGGIDLRGSSSGSGYGFRISAIDSTGVHLVIGNRSSSTTYTERMRIDSSGNVGIGTISPTQKLHVVTSTNTGTSADNAAIYVSSTNRNGYFQADGSLSASLVFSQGLTEKGRIFYDHTSNFMAFGVNGAWNASEKMRIDSSGNVGIGTNSPSAPLNIYNNTASTGYAWIKIESGTSAAYAPRIQLSDSRTGAGAANYQLISGGNSGAFEVYDTTSSASRLLINSSGNVGIGTTSPSQKLDVNGNVAAVILKQKTSTNAYNNFYTDGGTTTNSGFTGVFNSSGTRIAYLGFWDSNNIVNMTETAYGITFGTNGSERMRIDSSGRVTKPYQPAFRATAGTTTTVGNYVKYDTIVFNIGGHYNTSTYTFTAPIVGLYFFEAHFLSNRTTGTGDTGYDFYVNGAAVKRVYDGKGGSENLHAEARGTFLVQLSANDTVKVYCYASVSGDILISNTHCQFSGYLLG